MVSYDLTVKSFLEMNGIWQSYFLDGQKLYAKFDKIPCSDNLNPFRNISLDIKYECSILSKNMITLPQQNLHEQ